VYFGVALTGCGCHEPAADMLTSAAAEAQISPVLFTSQQQQQQRRRQRRLCIRQHTATSAQNALTLTLSRTKLNAC